MYNEIEILNKMTTHRSYWKAIRRDETYYWLENIYIKLKDRTCNENNKIQLACPVK